MARKCIRHTSRNAGTAPSDGICEMVAPSIAFGAWGCRPTETGAEHRDDRLEREAELARPGTRARTRRSPGHGSPLGTYPARRDKRVPPAAKRPAATPTFARVPRMPAPSGRHAPRARTARVWPRQRHVHGGRPAARARRAWRPFGRPLNAPTHGHPRTRTDTEQGAIPLWCRRYGRSRTPADVAGRW